MSVILVKFIHPPIGTFTMTLSELSLSIVSLILFAFILIDLVHTVSRIVDLDAKLKDLNEKINNAINNSELKTENNFDSGFIPPMSKSEISKTLNFQERRVIKAFPKMRSKQYNETLENIKKAINAKKDKKAK